MPRRPEDSSVESVLSLSPLYMGSRDRTQVARFSREVCNFKCRDILSVLWCDSKPVSEQD